MAAKSGVPGTVLGACAALLAVLLVFAGCRKNGGLTVEPGPMPDGNPANAALTGILTGVYRGEELIRPEGVYVDV
ncbi:MAG: hypothetical protein II836_10820, partial [Clostridia bacterium]|nr:hypothetical protein [Clostridia bacterium]